MIERTDEERNSLASRMADEEMGGLLRMDNDIAHLTIRLTKLTRKKHELNGYRYIAALRCNSKEE